MPASEIPSKSDNLALRVHNATDDAVATAAARCFAEGRNMADIMREYGQGLGHEVCQVMRLLMPVYTEAVYPSLTEEDRAQRERERWDRVQRLGTRSACRAYAIHRLNDATLLG